MGLRHLGAVALAGGALLTSTGLAAAAPVQVSGSGWAWGNPTPQGNTLRAMDVAGGRAFAVGDAGTVLRTDDNGAGWTGLPSGTALGLTTVQAVSRDVVVVSGGDGCVLRRSDDGGLTFRRVFVLAEQNCPDRVAQATFVTPDVGYVALRDGSILRTTDKGESFAKQTSVPGTPTSSGGGGASVTALWFTSPDRGVAITGNRAFETVDQGNSWRPLAQIPSSVRLVEPTGPTTAYAIGDNALLRSADGGQTWKRVPAGDGQNLTGISCVGTSPCVLTVAAGDRLLRGTFPSTCPEPPTTTTTTSTTTTPTAPPCDPDTLATLTPVTPSTRPLRAAAFTAAGRIAAVGDAGTTVISADSGGTFAQVGGDLPGDYTAVRNGPVETTAFALGRGGAMARTLDGGDTWRVLRVPTSQQVIDASFATPSEGFVLDARGGLFRTANAGDSFQTLDPGTATRPRGLVAIGDAVVLVPGGRGLLRQVDGGRFDTVGDRDVLRSTFARVTRAGGGAIVAHGSGALAVSGTRGATWRAIARPKVGSGRKARRVSVRDAAFASSRSGFVLDTAGRLWSTTNGGRSWTEQPGTGTAFGLDLAFGSSRAGWLQVPTGDPSQGATVLRTSDGGRTWRPQRLAPGETLGITGLGAQRGYALLQTPGTEQADAFFATATGGDAGTASTLRLTTRSTRISRRALRRAGRRVTVTGTLSGAQGGERITVARRDAGGTRWTTQAVTAGANGGSFTATFRNVSRSSLFVAQWAGDSGRRAAGSSVVSIRVR